MDAPGINNLGYCQQRRRVSLGTRWMVRLRRRQASMIWSTFSSVSSGAGVQVTSFSSLRWLK